MDLGHTPRILYHHLKINSRTVATNNGPDTALNVSLTDTVPAGTTFNSLSISSGT